MWMSPPRASSILANILFILPDQHSVTDAMNQSNVLWEVEMVQIYIGTTDNRGKN